VPRGAAILACALMLVGCGGGGGGAAPPANVSISLPSNQVAVSASTIESTGPAVGLGFIVKNLPPGGQLFVEGNFTKNGLVSVGTDPASQSITFSFQSPMSLPPGVYNDTVNIKVCYDTACSSQVTGSPLLIHSQFTVTAGANIVPTLSSMNPGVAIVGDSAFTLTVNGTAFKPTSTIFWNGTALTTSYVNDTQVTAAVPASDLASAGSISVTATDQPTGGVNSNALTFTVFAVPFALNSISPSYVYAGAPEFVVTVTGIGFTASSMVEWNGFGRSTTFVSSTQLQAQIPASDITTAGSANINVRDPSYATVAGPLPLSIRSPAAQAVAFQINPGHSGSTTFANASLPSSSTWSVTLDGPPSYALIANANVFVTVSTSNGNSEVIALNESTGAVVWGPTTIQGPAAAAYDSGTLFVLSGLFPGFGPDDLVAFDAATGTVKWVTQLSTMLQYGFSSAPTALNGMVYTTSSGIGGDAYGVDESSGSILWTQSVANGDDSTPAVTADGVYLSFPCQTYDLAPGNGQVNWRDSVGCVGGGGGTTVVANGVVYSPNAAGSSYNGDTFDTQSGAQIGSYVADYPPAIGSTMGYFLQTGTLRGITLSSNAAAWSFTGDGTLVTSPILVDQWVFIGGSSGNLYALNASTGQQVWSKNLGAAIPTGAGWAAGIPLSGLSAGDGLLIVPAGNTLTAYTLSTNP
jgi:outer membrane protein assembly factor BamB